MLLAGAALSAVAIFGLSSGGSSSTGRAAPELPRERLAGPSITVPALLAGAHGRPSLVVFWASWCGPCTREAPEVERFYRSPSGHGRVAGVDWSDGLEGARSFVRRYSWTFPNMRDAEGTVGNAYGLTVLPTTFVVNSHGRIRSVLHGPQSEATLERALAEVEHGRGNQV